MASYNKNLYLIYVRFCVYTSITAPKSKIIMYYSLQCCSMYDGDRLYDDQTEGIRQTHSGWRPVDMKETHREGE